MRLYLILLISLLFSLSTLSCKGQEQKAAKVENVREVPQKVVHRVGVEDFKKELSADVQLVDVRTPEEYAAGHIENALNYNVNGPDFASQVAGLDKSKPVLLYCKMGGRSARAAKALEGMGFTTIYDLEGGYTDWVK